MKKIFKFICAAIIFSLMIPYALSIASSGDYSDVDGHWAENALRRAYNDGLIDGYNGNLLPDDSITGAQALEILCRVLDAGEQADISGMALAADKWYYDYAAKSIYLGLISIVDITFLESPISRQDAFCILAEAFELVESNPDMSALESFSDYGIIKTENRRALASLTSQGLVGGYYGKLGADDNTTRAAFLSVVYRVLNKVDLLMLYQPGTKTNVEVATLPLDHLNQDLGLAGANVSIDAPSSLPAGDTLTAAAIIKNAAPGSVYGLTWYIDGVPVLEQTTTIGGAVPELHYEFEYSRDMPDSAEIRVVLSYVTKAGEDQKLSAVSSVALENYSNQYWMSLDAPDVLEKVTLGYIGDYTLDWALANDLGDYDKEVWINSQGYTSDTDYILWINLAYQRVNVFERSGEDWVLIRTCLVGTGAPGRGTPPGVWTISYKQLYGWTTAAYTVKPVVRFMGTVGYAFHSRLYYPGTTTISNPGIGYPISNGCIRMYDEDIWFIYDNIPDGTTVVVY